MGAPPSRVFSTVLLLARLFLAVGSAGAAAAIDFEDVAVAPGVQLPTSDFASGGFFFDSALTSSRICRFNLTNGTFIADNGTTYLAWEDETNNSSPCFWDGGFGVGNNVITMARLAGESFNLYSLDVAEWDQPSTDQKSLHVSGLRDGVIVTTLWFDLDMVADGTGPLEDFETITFDSSWRDLTSVRFDNRGTIQNPAAQLTIDNIEVEPACGDGRDNDGDGLVDYPEDPGCESTESHSEKSSALPCDDGADNDGDGATDYIFDADSDGISDPPGDLGCHSPMWPQEDPQCQDGLNNDFQTGIDFDGGESIWGVAVDQPDPQCVGMPWRTRETASRRCGFGVELFFLLLPLMWLFGQRKRSRQAT